MSESLRQCLPNRYLVSSVVKSGGSLPYMMKDIDLFCKDFTISDHVVIMIGNRHTYENTYRYLKGGIRKLMTNCSNTNVLMVTIPYGFRDFGQNDMIQRINQYMEANLFRCKNKFCVYTNKVLFKDDYDKSSILKKTGRQKFATYIAEYIIGRRSDDRPSSKSRKHYITEVESAESFMPSNSGSTSALISPSKTLQPVSSLPMNSKNKHIGCRKKIRIKDLLKKLIGLLE